ncbi:MAG: MFS transporter [Acidobacteriota bacterium]|nr:MFS transporter [Acidobacteriota bacterium]MDE3169563.1 MFS transporter [Acidobacteriota bacterium]
MTASGNSRPSGRVAFSYPDFTYLQLARFFSVIGIEMQSVAVGWQVYEITNRALDLGLVGLAQFLPGILLFLISGHAADRYSRSRVLMLSYGGLSLSSALLLAITLRGTHSVYPIYGVMLLIGVARSFSGPAGRALLPAVVPEEHFQNAVAWGSSIFQTATILGPAAGGLIYALFRGPAVVYGIAIVATAGASLAALRIKFQPKSAPREDITFRTVLAGLRYIWEHNIVLGAVSLDLFAVLLGGAVALLPVYAKEVLHTGPWGLGLLRCAPGIGAGAMAILLAHRPLRRQAGAVMLWCVGGFGAFTIVFGVSHSLALSMVALALVGASDMVSVVIRGVLVQLQTPDEMRGRVNAVEMIFIGASNEFGQFESGVTAAWLGGVPAVILGGIGSLVVTVLWAILFPDLRGVDRLAGAGEPARESTLSSGDD